MPDSWDEAREKCQAALGDLVEGGPEAFNALWSHADDTVIMGGVDRGWEAVAARLEWASAGIGAKGRRVENILTVGGELACTVDLEHMERTSEGRTTIAYFGALRSTDWKTASGR